MVQTGQYKIDLDAFIELLSLQRPKKKINLI